jgi:hypothetical protein
VLGCEVEGYAMVALAQERLAGGPGREHARLAFEAEVAFETAEARHQADDGFGEVDVEIVTDDVPPNVRGITQHAAEKSREILFGPPIADHAFDLAGGDVEGGDQGLRAMAAVLELAPLDLAWQHRQPWRDALQRLNAGHLVDGNRAMGVVGAGRGLVNLADVGALGIEGGIGLRGQPVTDAMWFEVGLFFKKRPTERCEMLGTRPRRMASSAISRWLQWLIGRSLSDGFSQVIAITAQICSGVYVAGAPDRGASASRSGTDCPSAARRHRLRQYRTVFGQTPSSRALARTRVPAAACRIMRARTANCCGVEWVRTSCSSTSRCSGKTMTGSAANKGIATSHLSPGFVMPQHSRFGSCLVPENHLRSVYLRTSVSSGVITFARLY